MSTSGTDGQLILINWLATPDFLNYCLSWVAINPGDLLALHEEEGLKVAMRGLDRVLNCRDHVCIHS